MKACMFVASPAGGDKARTRKIYLKEGRRLVGHIFEPDGRGLGYKYKRLGRKHASSKTFSTIKQAKEGSGCSNVSDQMLCLQSKYCRHCGHHWPTFQGRGNQVIHLTYNDVIHYAGEAVEEKGKDYVYDQRLCSYVNDIEGDLPAKH